MSIFEKEEHFVKDTQDILLLLSTIQEKHFPGQHNQANHGNRYGKPGGSGKPAGTKPTGSKPAGSGSAASTVGKKPVGEKPAPLPKLESLPNAFASLNPKERQAKMLKEYADWQKNLSYEEKSAIESYTGSAYSPINAALRSGKEPAGSYKEIASNIDSALEKGSAPFSFTVKRGMSLWDSKKTANVIASFEKNVGKVFSDKGFISTSVDDMGFSGNIQYTIHVPKGSKGAYIDAVSSVPGEHEFLLPRSTQFRVLKVTKGKYGLADSAHVELMIVGKSSTKPLKDSGEPEEVATSFYLNEKHYPGLHNQQNHGNRYGAHPTNPNLLLLVHAGGGKPGHNTHTLVPAGPEKPPEPPKVTKPKVEKPVKPKVTKPKKEPVKKPEPKPEPFKDTLETMSPYEKHTKMLDEYAKWQKGLTAKEKEAVGIYTGSSYTVINSALREGKEPQSYVKGLIENLDSALEKGSAPFSFDVKRGISVFGEKKLAKIIDNFNKNVGKVFSDKAFSSTSVGSGFSGSIQMTIHVPKGTKGAYIAGLSGISAEYEYLLPRNTQYRVEKVTKNSWGGANVELTVVGINKNPGKISGKKQGETSFYRKESKHYPGQHNQANHGNRFGKPGTNALASLSVVDRHHTMLKAYDGWQKGLTPQEKKSVETYTGSAYGQINKALREGKSPPGLYKEIMKNIDSALEKGTAPFGLTVKRGITIYPDSAGNFIDTLEKNIGKTFSDKAFVSTSTNNQGFSGNIQFTIHIPKGAKGAFVAGVSGISEESEFLLPRDTQFKVLKVTKTQQGMYSGAQVELSVLKPGKKKSSFFEEFLKENKHYPGAHNQNNHGNRYGTHPTNPNLRLLVHAGGGKPGHNTHTELPAGPEQPPKPKETFQTGTTTLEEIGTSENKLSELLDSNNSKQESWQTKKKIAKNLAWQLKDNPDFQKMVEDWESIAPGQGAVYASNITPGEVCGQLVQSWQKTSGDSDPRAVALQLATEKEFGLQESAHPWTDEVKTSAESIWGSHEAGLRAFVRAQYDNTQAFFKKNGISEIYAFRAMAWHPGSEPDLGFNDETGLKDVQLQPMSAFTTKMDVASGGVFGTLSGGMHVLVGAKIPVKSILGSAQTGFGCKAENEVIVLGGKHTMWKYGWKGNLDGGSQKIKENFVKLSQQKTKFTPWNADENLMSADWTKETWDFPEISTQKAFTEMLQKWGMTEEEFKKLPAYQLVKDKLPWIKGEKHYPGQHNQANHGNRYGKPGGDALAHLSADPEADYYGKLDAAKAKGTILEKKYSSWKKNLSAAELEALGNYSGSDYKDINAGLREGKTLYSGYQDTVNGVDSALEKSTAPMNFTVKRGLSFSYYNIDTFVKGLQDNIGKTFSDKGFISTSVSDGFDGNVNMTIHIPKGSKGAYIANVSEHPGEFEYLLPRNTKFKVYKVEKTGHMQYNVELGVVKQGRTKTPKKSSDGFWEFPELKHYPGMHNQANHGNRYGKPGGTGLSQFHTTLKDPERHTKLQKQHTYLVEQYGAWEKSLSPQESGAVTKYTGWSYKAINTALRNGQEIPSHLQETVDKLDSALEKGSAPFAFTVKRGLDFYGPEGDAFGKMLQENIGKVFSDKGFVSTSTDKAFTGKVSMTIHVPKGAKGAYIANLSSVTHEHEFLIPRNARFKVYKVKQSKAGKWSVELGLVKEGKTHSPKKQNEDGFWEFKHLAGQHNQANHGNRYGKPGASNFASKTDGERSELMATTYVPWVKGLSEEESKGIGYYSDEGYTGINETLRKNAGNIAAFEITKTIQGALEKGRLPFPITVQRAIGTSSEKAEQIFQEMVKNTGKVFSDPAFVSTTTNAKASFGKFDPAKILMTIHVPKNAKGAYIEDVSQYPSEHEFLMSSGSRFKVLKTGKDDLGNYTVELSFLKPGGQKNPKKIKDWTDFFETKHYPGAHDQSTHGNRFGRASANAFAGKGLTEKDKLLTEAYQKWHEEDLSSQEVTAIRMYTGMMYKQINAVLRNEQPNSQATQIPIEKATSGLEKGRLPFPITVSRGLGFGDEEKGKAFFQEMLKNKGKVFSDPAFTSTTLENESDFGQIGKPVRIQMKIHLPKNAKGGYVEPITSSKNEFEFLLPPKTRFKVLKAEQTSDGRYSVELSMLKPGGQKNPKKSLDWRDFFEVKHYPGAHNQQNHGNRYGKPGASNPLQSVGEEGLKGDQARRQYMEKTAEPWVNSLTDGEKNSIYVYTTSAFQDMNNSLRKGTAESSLYKKQIEQASDALEKGFAPFGMTVTRGMSFGDTPGDLEGFLGQLKGAKGKIFTDKAFVSTTTNTSTPYDSPNYVRLKIHIPKNAKGAYVGGISEYGTEGEFLLSPQSRFKVLNVTKQPGGAHYIELALQKPGGRKKPKSGKEDFETFQWQREEKHYPGAHNQQNHGNRYGKPGASNPLQNIHDDYEKRQYMSNLAKPWVNSLSEDEYESVYTYTGSAYSDMNKALRTGTVAESGYDFEIEHADKALDKGFAPFAMTVSRTLGFYGSNTSKMHDLINELKNAKGKIFTDKAFVSTTTNQVGESGGPGYVRVQIHVPKNAKGAYVGGMSKYQEEGEFLLPSQSRFKVLNVHQDSTGSYQVELSLQKPGGRKKPKSYEAFSSEYKHLPGVHNQQNHGNRYGKPGILNPLQGMAEEERQKHLIGQAKPWVDSLTSSEKYSVTTYTSSAYSPMNKALREGTVITSTYKPQIDQATNALEKGFAPYPMTVARTLTFHGKPEALDTFLNELRGAKGKIFTDKAFVSTTVNDVTPYDNTNYVHVSIHVPKNAKGAYVGEISKFPEEGEFLLPPSSRFKVLKVEQQPKGGYHIELSLQKPGGRKKPILKSDLLEIAEMLLYLEQKHYPGQHDQRNHGNRYGSASASQAHAFQNMDWFERRAFLRKASKPWINSLKDTEMLSITTYTSNAYEYMNDALRTDTVHLSSYANEIEFATNGLEKGFAPIAMTVKRGMSIYDSNTLNNYVDMLTTAQKSGKVFSDKAFLSTTISPDSQWAASGGKGFAIIIHVPKNARGGYVEEISKHPGESEFLLPPNSRFKVLSVTQNEKGQHQVELALQKPGGRGKPPKK